MKKLVKLAQGAVAAGVFLLSFGAMAAPGHGAGHGGGHDAAAPIGKPGNPAKVSRTIVVDMTDAMRFTPDKIDVKAGETRHEMVLGTTADLNSHYQMMLKDPGMRHEEPNSVSLEAGKAGDIVWTFDKAGTVAFACLEPGHYPAGMKGAVSVK
jgi:uncharacterized cupredoxin-like copper-binding protein